MSKTLKISDKQSPTQLFGRACHADTRPEQKIAKRQNQSREDVVVTEIVATDVAIDKLVYELYGLTEEKIKIVGDAGK